MDIAEDSRPLLQPDCEGRTAQDSYLDKVSNGNLYLATFAAVLGPLSFGFVLGYSSPAIPELRKINDPQLRLDGEQASWFGSIVTVGAALGGILGGCVVDKIGRKLTLMFSALPFIFGFTIIVAAQGVWMLYVGRVLTGLASGLASLAAPLYISETAHERVRGTMGSCVQLMVVTGILGSYLAGLVLSWRWLAIACSVPPALMMLSMCFMPETPRYLLSQGLRQEAQEALRFLRGPDVPIELECTQIEGATREQDNCLKLSDLRDPGIYKPLLVGMFMMLFQQLTGVNAIMFYAETIFEEAHFKNSDVATVIVGLAQVIVTALAALIMDRAGRKVLLIISGVAMSISTAVFGVYFRLSATSTENSTTFNIYSGHPALASQDAHIDLAWLALTSMGIFIAGFALGWGPTPWLVMSEIFPTSVRGLASAACVLTNWTSAFVVTKTFQNLMNLLTSAGTFWLFSALCAINIVFTIFCVPETKGKSLEQIQLHFKGAPHTV